ncbi:MAG: hypothetical protein H7835_07325 [Magnetococcus sp. XQGC-1]
MSRSSNLTPEQRAESVLALLRREEPAPVLARRYSVSTKPLGHWKDDFIAAGTSGLASEKRQAVDNAKQFAVLESAVAGRDRLIGELTIANVTLKKWCRPSLDDNFRQELTAMCQSNPIVRQTKLLALLNISRSSWYHQHVGKEVTDGSSFLDKRFQEFIVDGFQHVRIQYRTPTRLGLLERFHQTLETEEVYWRLYDNPGHCRQSLEAYHGVDNTIRRAPGQGHQEEAARDDEG